MEIDDLHSLFFCFCSLPTMVDLLMEKRKYSSDRDTMTHNN